MWTAALWSASNSKWVTDISYIHTKQGVLYLSMIRDLYDMEAPPKGTWKAKKVVLNERGAAGM